MKTITLKSGLKLLIALTMIPATFVPEVSYAKGETCAPKKACDEAVAGAGATDAAISAQKPATTTRAAGEQLNQAGAANAQASCNAQKVCEDEAKKCKPDQNSCTKKKCEDIKSAATRYAAACTANGGAATGGAATQSAASSSGGSSDGMMGALMGAAMGAGLMAMMMKKKQDEAAAAMAAQQQQMYNGALQANGTIDCSKPDALAYRDCNQQMENRCRTILDDPTCQQFSSRYCGPTSGAAAQIMVQPQAPPGVILGVDPSTLYGATGEGMGTQYCKGVTGWNYCKTSGREQCPSCLQIQRNQSAACAQNPALCLAQNSVSEIEKAKSTCPTDPAFADPSFVAGGGAQVPPALGAPGSLPAVVLPQSVSAGGSANGGATVSTGSNIAGTSQAGGGTGGISTMSANGPNANPNEQGTREGYANNGNSQASYGGGGAGGSAVVGSYGGGREFASAGGMKPASVAGGPATDVEGQYGPSLFTTSSQVIRRRCQAGRLNNCP